MSDIYNIHATELIKDVIPRDDVKTLINEFMQYASINMGNDFTDNTLDRTIEIIERNFRFLPVCYVRSAFVKGSLGNFGAGRLIPRTINSWLNEITIEYNRNSRKEAGPVELKAFDLEKYPVGRAICMKIDWYKSGLLEDWDKIDLKVLAGKIGRGEAVSIKDFENDSTINYS